MTDTTISALPAAAGLTGTEVVPGDQSGNTVKITTAAIAALAAGGVTSFNTRAGAITLTSADVTGALTYTPLNQAAASFGGSAAKLTTPRNIAMTGDVSWNVNFDGSANATAAGTLANTAVTPGTYSAATITVDAKGRITNAASGAAGGVTSFNTRTGAITLTSADVTGALTYTPLDQAAASFGGSAAKLTTARNIAMTGDVSWNVNFDGSANATAAGTLANTAVTPGTYSNATVTVDAKGRVTNAVAGGPGSIVSILTGNGSGGFSAPVKAMAYLNTAANATSAGWQKVPMDTAFYDPGGYWDSVNKRFKGLPSGYYAVLARIRFNTQASTNLATGLNGAQYQGIGDDISNGSVVLGVGGVGMVPITSLTDYIEIFTFQGATRAYTTGAFDTWYFILGPF